MTEWLSRLPEDDKRIRHNHLTRDIKPRGVCPACDAYCRADQSEPTSLTTESQDEQWT